MKIQTSALLTALVSCVSVVSGQQGSCMGRLFEEVSTCFTANGLKLHVESGQQDATMIMKETQVIDTSEQCKQKEAYKKAIECSLTKLQDCLMEFGMAGALPLPDKFQEGFDVVCDKQQSFDNDCLKQVYPRMMECGEKVVHTLVQDSDTELSMEEIICLSTDVNYDCADKYLRSCSNHTLSIYLEQLNLYQVPRACVNRRPGRPGRVRYTLANSGNSVAASVLIVYIFASLASLSLLR